MKTILFNVFLLAAIGVTAQTEVDFLNAIGSGQTANLDSYLTQEVNLCINDNQETISRNLAIEKIKNFLAANPILNYKILHNGKSADRNSSYRVARLKTRSGTYRVFAYSEANGKSSKVVEVRIDAM